MGMIKNVFHSVMLFNKEHYSAYSRSLEERYLQVLLTNTLSNTFYCKQQELLEDAEQYHHEMAVSNPCFMAQAIVYARNEGYMRAQPLFGLAILSGYHSDLFAKIFMQVVRIPSDLSDFLTIMKGLGRGEGGRAIKRQVNVFLSQVTPYWALKYNGRGRGYSLGDAIATSHPKPKDEVQQALFKYLRGHAVELGLLPQIDALRMLKKTDIEEEQLYWIKAGRLPYEAVTGAIKPTAAIWQELMRQMPLLALLRHMNTLQRAGVLDHQENVDYMISRLTDRNALSKAKVLPFMLLTAYHAVAHPELRDALREAVELTFQNLPSLGNKTAIFLDISGSMNGKYLEIGSVFALALYKKTAGSSLFWLFDTEVIDAKPSRKDSILTQAANIMARGGTDTGAPVAKLIRQRIHADQIIMITDEQQNTGNPFYEQLQKYRSKVNRDAKAFIIDIAPYTNSSMVPQLDNKTHYIYGWSEQVLSYIARAVQGYASLVAHVEGISLEG